MKRAYAVLGLLVLVLIGFRVVTLFRGGGDDKAMIQEALRKSIEASREGKAGSVLDALSNSLVVNDQEARGNFGQISNFIKNQRPDITVENQSPIVSGDEAHITSDVTLKVSMPVFGDKSVRIKNVGMIFKRETGREYFVFPVKKWRLAEVRAPEMNLDTFSLE